MYALAEAGQVFLPALVAGLLDVPAEYFQALTQNLTRLQVGDFVRAGRVLPGHGLGAAGGEQHQDHRCEGDDQAAPVRDEGVQHGHGNAY